jgi:hypothetical protein
MINSLKLDDRSYEDIREEAIKNIVKHCPSWTNHNASDPGIALVELFASMTEMLQYRFNRVPHKNYMAFLDMLGINANFISPAVSRVQFSLIENFEQGRENKTTKIVPKGTQFIAKDKEIDDKPLIFETIRESYISNSILKKIISKTYNREKKQYHFNNHQPTKAFKPFEITEYLQDESIIYLQDSKFEMLKSQNIVTLIFTIHIKRSQEIDSEWFQNIEWEYFNGEIWKELKTVETSQELKKEYRQENAEHFFVTLQGLNLDLQPSIKEEILDKEKYYIRARINTEDYPWLKNEEIKIYEIYKKSESAKSGIKPHQLFHNYAPIDLNSKIHPFGKTPKKEDTFLITDNLLSKKGEELTFNFKREQSSSTFLKVEWEYPIDKNDWILLPLKSNTVNHLRDSGTIKFEVPKNIQKANINGEEIYAIRARVVEEDYTKEEKRREEEYLKALQEVGTTPINPFNIEVESPYFDDIRISYSEKKEIIEKCYIFNNETFIREIDFSDKDKDNSKKSFLSEKIEDDTSLYFGFDSYIHNENPYLDLFFNIQAQEIEEKKLNYKWEILNKDRWEELEVIIDETKGLKKSGDMRFKITSDIKLVSLFDFQGMWIRINFTQERKEFNFPYRVGRILQNSTVVYQQETIKNEFIGTSIGIPSMKFKLNNKNIVSPPVISIDDETYYPIAKEKRFIDYNGEDKVYKFNGLNAEILFGDNKYGKIPNPKKGIYAKEYIISFGEDGNVGKEQLLLSSTIPSVQSATNITPATGGTNAETLDNLIQRAPQILRIKNRVVTAKDYENASIDFSPYILKAKAIATDNQENSIKIFVVTKDILEKSSMKENLLLGQLENRLKEMGLITILPKVSLPEIVKINIKVKLVSTVESVQLDDVMKSKLKDSAEKYFDVTKAFPMGKVTISEADLYKILHTVSFNYYYQKIKIWRSDEIEPNSANRVEIRDESSIIQLQSFEIED